MDNLLEEINDQDSHENSENLSTPRQEAAVNQNCNKSCNNSTTKCNTFPLYGKEISAKPAEKNDLQWQDSKPTIRDRNAVMFNNDLLSDVHFVVGTKKNMKRIPAHKYVLAIGSSVFFAMFNGDLAEDHEDISIPDVEPAAFLILLKYLYCDSITLEADTVLGTLYAAKKYIVPTLAHACIEFLETSLSYKNASILLSQSCLFEEEDLTLRCWEVIDAQTELALETEGFVDIDINTLKAILSRETLNVKETVVFNAAHKWAAAECRRSHIEQTMENKREVLGSALTMIRVPAMSLQEFADGPANSGILTKEEIIDIFLWYSASNKPNLTFNTKARKGLTPNYCHRFQSSAYRSNQWRYRGRCDSIRFMSAKRIFVAGYGLYGSSSSAANYTAHIKLLHNKLILAEDTVKFFSDGQGKTFPVWFRHPIQCEPNEFYTASVILDGNELSYFGQEGLSEVVCNEVTIQFQCSSDSTNGTGVQGGQIPELIFYQAFA